MSNGFSESVVKGPQPSCCGLCNKDDAMPNAISINHNNSFHQVVSAEHNNVTAEVKQQKQEMDNLLSQAMNKLSFQERQEHQEVLHGVDGDPIEDETRLENALQELENHLANTKSGSIYEMAESMDPAYVRARAFQVLFLRANEYNPKASADQMLRFFETKQQLFGNDKLVKDITISDLDEDDIAYLKYSPMQFAGKDRAGRQVFVHIAGLAGALGTKKTTLMNLFRVLFYVIMKALQSEETQIRGIVSIYYALGNLKAAKHQQQGLFDSLVITRALPQKKAAIHLCVDDMGQYTIASFVVKIMPAAMRARMRLHFGSLLECQYQLSTYGILPESLPLDAHGNYNKDRQLLWVKHRALEEKSGRTTHSNVSELVNPTPTNDDVLFTGKLTKHLGNKRFRGLVHGFSNDYDSGNAERKRQIVSDIIANIEAAGGRFLKQQSNATNILVWEEVSVDEIRKKTMQSFRNIRRRHNESKQKSNDSIGILILGEPRPEDVIFGRAQKNAGNQLLQRLLTENFEEYESLNRGVKMRLVEGIMETIRDQGGRFLELASSEKGKLVEVPHDYARERISKYFRNHRRPAPAKPR